MTIKIKRLDDTQDDWENSEVLNAQDLNDTFNAAYDYIYKNFFSVQPIGSIIAFPKGITGLPALPTGWFECDGTNGTPNLNNRFLRGVDPVTQTTGVLGGSESHSHGTNFSGAWGGTSSLNNPFSTTATSHLPPFTRVVWVMRVS